MKIKWLINSIKKINIVKFSCAFALFILIVIIFLNSFINYRLDDINFYAEFIPKRIFTSGISDIQYSLQGFFTLVSLIIEYGSKLSFLNIYTEFYPVAIVIWIPALLSAWMISFMLIDMTSYLEKRIKSKKWLFFLAISITCIFILDYWYFTNVNAPGTLRRLAIPYILIFLYNLTGYRKTIILSLVIGGFISISSSAFFLSVIILFIYLLYNILLKKSNYLRKLLIIVFFPLLYGAVYVERLFVVPYFFAIIMVIYILLIVLVTLKIDLKFEKYLNKYGTAIVAIFIIIFYLAAILFPFQIVLMIGERTFFTPINNFDMVPNLINGQSIFEVVFNGLYWALVFLSFLLVIKIKKYNWYILLVLFSIFLFFNPITYELVVQSLTASGYFRITDILFNVIVLYEICYIVYDNNKLKFFLVICVIGMLLCRVVIFDFSNLEKKENYNYIYHTDNQDIKIIEKLSEEYLKFEGKDQFNIASQIYGAQFFTNFNITNLLEDRFSYVVREVSEFERVFYRRTPGYDDLLVDYNHACSLAFEKQTDYVILDAQYNWKLQEGLWPCSELLFEDGNYRILKMNYDYWEWNILQGYTEKFITEPK
ncbi:MAG: hypothetical protein VB122_03385 [Erysipelotrichales bacterium]|nr:hypothetical protein [Erysipelotrichales bacterium]